MIDIGFIVFLCLLLGLGFKRPFLFVAAYIYIDVVSPQQISYYLLNSVPVSLITFSLAILGWLIVDKKDDVRFSPRQGLLLLLLVYCGLTTFYGADFPEPAQGKWEWVWRALVFAIFLPLTLRTRLRIETILLFMVLSASAIIIGAGIKTALGGSGYGSFAMLVNSNSGLYEDSTLAMVAIAIIPIILWFAKYGTVFPPDWRVKLFCYALCFACLLVPIGTQARTGLVCAVILGGLLLRDSQRKMMYIGAVALVSAMALPFVPSAFSERMSTISNYQADNSASTRLAIWAWTWEYAKENPFGGGFLAYIQNRIVVETRDTQGTGAVRQVEAAVVHDRSRAYHSSYFEMLGEQGFPGLFLWLSIHAIGIWRMEWLRRHYLGSRAPPEDQWVSPLATALFNAHVVYMFGSLFVGIAFQPFVYMIVGVQIGLDTYLARVRKERGWRPIRESKPRPQRSEAAA